MIKTLLFYFLLFLPILAQSFESLPDTYTIKVGSKNAPSKIVEYFSLSCPLCLRLIQKDFKEIYEAYIQTGKILWEFHPDPQDITTLQLLVCLEKLSPSKRWPFFWEITTAIKATISGRNCFLMQELMKQFGRPVPLLHDIKFLETTNAYREAFKYLNQKGIPEELPSIEKDGKHIQGIPTKKLVATILKQEEEK